MCWTRRGLTDGFCLKTVETENPLKKGLESYRTLAKGFFLHAPFFVLPLVVKYQLLRLLRTTLFSFCERKYLHFTTRVFCHSAVTPFLCGLGCWFCFCVACYAVGGSVVGVVRPV